jgi:hypothetical protein
MASPCHVHRVSTSFCKAGKTGKSSGASGLVFIVIERMAVNALVKPPLFKEKSFNQGGR